MESVGERLKRIRKENNYTQDMLAEKLQVEPAAISKYETNRVPIPQENLIRICDLFNITTDYLLGRSNTANKEDEKLIIAARSDVDLSELTEDEKKYILDFIKFVKNNKKK